MPAPSIIPKIVKKIIGIQGPAGQKFMPPSRLVTGAADTPTAADHGGVIGTRGATATTFTVNDLGENKNYAVQWQGTAQPTLVAGTNVTLTSGSFGTSMKPARRGGILTVNCTGTGEVFVNGDMA